ncbi:MAG: formate dehydrogenase subunit gamma, partial [Bacillota bacterium]
MFNNAMRYLAVLVLGAALAVPFATAAQGVAATQAKAAKENTPTTAPNSREEPQKQPPNVAAPKVESPPQPGQGSTAVPGWNNPPANWASVSEKSQYASLPGNERNRLIQGAGREWRVLHNGVLTQFGGWIIVGVLALLIVFYLIKGPIKLHGAPTGRLIERFNAIERAAHWTTAIAFVLLALTGITMFFGKHIILPWLGYSGFAWLTIVSKNLHNFLGPLFMFALVVMFLIYVKDNVWRSWDTKWLGNIGGVFSGHETPSGRFNALEKLWFWGGLVLLGIVMSATGLVLDFPNWNQGREMMQYANMVHDIGAGLFIAAGLGHIYIGTIGMVGAYRAM